MVNISNNLMVSDCTLNKMKYGISRIYRKFEERILCSGCVGYNEFQFICSMIDGIGSRIDSRNGRVKAYKYIKEQLNSGTCPICMRDTCIMLRISGIVFPGGSALLELVADGNKSNIILVNECKVAYGYAKCMDNIIANPYSSEVDCFSFLCNIFCV